jgi:electron transport complex protein RnfG
VNKPLAFDKNILISAFALTIFAVIGTTIVSSTDWLTRDRIKANEIAARLKQINEILPQQLYDNDLLQDTLTLPPGAITDRYPVTVYRAQSAGKYVAVIMQTTAPSGYSGPIKLLIGILSDGTLSGVRVLKHKETPGLGDKIELRKNKWILSFNGKSLQNPEKDSWKVKKDGGEFDQFTGATISPRAVTQAVRDSLIYFEAHRQTLFDPKSLPVSTAEVQETKQ